jgi:hypothetical protein
MSVVSLSVSNDGVLGVVAPIGMAAAKGTCLVVDLVADSHREGVSLASIVSEGPRKSHLEPQHSGVSFLHNGGVDLPEAAEVLEALCSSWPNVLVSIADRSVAFELAPAVEVQAILIGPFVAPLLSDAVLQPVGLGGPPKRHDGHVLAPLSARTVRSILTGIVNPGSRWVRSWLPVWETL